MVIHFDGQGQLNTSSPSLTFAPGSWNTSQQLIVTALDDHVDEGRASLNQLLLTSTSLDAAYNKPLATDATKVDVGVTDNDQAGIHLSAPSLSVREGGASVAYNVTLTSQPNKLASPVHAPDGEVYLYVEIQNGRCAHVASPHAFLNATATCGAFGACPAGQQCVHDATAFASPVALIFTAANWNVPQTVQVTAHDDFIVEALPFQLDVRHRGVSNDPRFDSAGRVCDDPDGLLRTGKFPDVNVSGVALVANASGPGSKEPCLATYYEPLQLPALPLTIFDNDDSNITLSRPAVDVQEGGVHAFYYVSLTAKPLSPVVVHLRHDAQVRLWTDIFLTPGMTANTQTSQLQYLLSTDGNLTNVVALSNRV